MPKTTYFSKRRRTIDWFDNNDTAPYMDEMAPADEEFSMILTEFPTRSVDLRLRSDLLVAIETLAERRGVPYQRLIQTWLLDMLRQEAPDLLPHLHI